MENNELDDAILEPQLPAVAARCGQLPCAEIVRQSISACPMSEVIKALNRETLNALELERR